jgi:hypothetical protein
MAEPAHLEAIQAPEIYRNTPFEYVLTAEAVQISGTAAKPMASTGAWVTKGGSIDRKPPLPRWMPPTPEPRR